VRAEAEVEKNGMGFCRRRTATVLPTCRSVNYASLYVVAYSDEGKLGPGSQLRRKK